MGRYVSLNFRIDARTPANPNGFVYLVRAEHPLLPEDLLLSTDPTVRLSDDPLEYGTVHQEETYKFLLMGFVAPDDTEDAAPGTELVFPNLGSNLIPILRSTVQPTIFTIRAVRMNALDVIELDWTDMRQVRSAGRGDQLLLTIARDDPELQPAIEGRQTANRFRGLHR
ncbi:MAG TPA: hypothetical protein VLA00_14540 [Xanthobacteraceae bacterium]|nr:hypothetical protein [Xanthobacteraceae bacterium]